MAIPLGNVGGENSGKANAGGGEQSVGDGPVLNSFKSGAAAPSNINNSSVAGVGSFLECARLLIRYLL